MNNLKHTKKSNAPPLARQKVKGKRQKAKGKRQKAKGKRQKAEFLHPFVQDFFPHLGGNVRRTKGLTLNFALCTLNLPDRATALLKMRDGPRGRAPATGLSATLITNPSVPLCVHSANSVVKINRRETRDATENTERYYAHENTTTFRRYCTEYVRLQEKRTC